MPRTYHFRSMPNFRRLVPTGMPPALHEGRRPKRPLNLYRSSRPDLLTAEEVDKFVELNIRSIVDLRSNFEYRKADGPKLLDAVFPVYQVLLVISHSQEPLLTRMNCNSYLNI